MLIVGLPRSGTTWLAQTLAAAPGVHYVHEPDNRNLDPLAVVTMQDLGWIPSLFPGDRSPDYSLLWTVAFAGGWPAVRGVGRLRRLLASPKPWGAAANARLLKGAARLASLRRPPKMHQLVKSVAATRAVEWIASEFDPTIIVCWRHPLNLVPAWLEQGWGDPRLEGERDALRSRFQGTTAWPPGPKDNPLEEAAWTICAESALLLERASDHPGWIVVSHENQCLDPPAGFRALFRTLGLDWTADVERRVVASNRPGTGFETERSWADEPRRWERRLSPGDRDTITRTIDRFASVSPVAAAAWSASPAVV